MSRDETFTSHCYVPFKVDRRLSAKERASLVDYYCEGHSGRETARRFGIGRTAVLAIVRDAGVAPRPPHQRRLDPIVRAE